MPGAKLSQKTLTVRCLHNMTQASAAQALHPTIQHHIVNTLGWTGLRPVQEASIGPILAGENVVILAPTAGGKTESAFFPLLSRAVEERWEGLSVLYLSPIRALLNNQHDRLRRLFGMIGHEVGLWHGDVTQGAKSKLREAPPTALLTTPESLEAMLISTKTQAPQLFGQLKVVVIDEVHAFAGADRGWQLLGVLGRLQTYAQRDLQRIGLSATVGNKEEIVSWLSHGSARVQRTIDPPRSAHEAAAPEVTLDWVETLENAALVIRALHRGERRLVFCDSRLQAEQLTRALRSYDVPTQIIHGSLSAAQRQLAERVFMEGQPGVLVATSALELGIDIGDLDRVINIDAPGTVASFLQRMGRTGRRPQTIANMLFLAVSDWGLVRAAAIMELWAKGFVEDVIAPPCPLHILAQQAMALAIEQPGVALDRFKAQLKPLIEAAQLDKGDAAALLRHMFERGYLYADGVFVSVGPRGERELGQRHYLELVSVFMTPPLFTVVYQRQEIGQVDQRTFLSSGKDDEGAGSWPMVVLLAGRSWQVKSISWNKKIAYVEPIELAGKSRWVGPSAPMTQALARAHREVLTGQHAQEGRWSKRATAALEELKAGFEFLEPDGATLIDVGNRVEYWGFEGTFEHQRLGARLEALGQKPSSISGLVLNFQDATLDEVFRDRLDEALKSDEVPAVPTDHPAGQHLKFNELLPDALLSKVLQWRIYGSGEA